MYHHLVGILLKINSTSKKVTKLRKDLEECRIQHDATLVSLKKKQADSIAEVMIISSYIKVIIYSKKIYTCLHWFLNRPSLSDVGADGSAEQDEGQVSLSQTSQFLSQKIFSG